MSEPGHYIFISPHCWGDRVIAGVGESDRVPGGQAGVLMDTGDNHTGEESKEKNDHRWSEIQVQSLIFMMRMERR